MLLCSCFVGPIILANRSRKNKNNLRQAPAGEMASFCQVLQYLQVVGGLATTLLTPPVFLFPPVSGFPCFVLEVILFWRCHCHCRCYSNSIQSDISHINDAHFLAPSPMVLPMASLEMHDNVVLPPPPSPPPFARTGHAP